MKSKITFVLLMVFVELHSQTRDSILLKIPFEGMDLAWINGQNRQKEFPLVFSDSKKEIVFTGVTYIDSYYNYNFARPIDNTHTISSTIGRHNEFTLNLVSAGVETNYKNVLGRIWLQYGQMTSLIQDLDASVRHGRNTNAGNLKYIREAAAGYHFNKWYGINLEMGIFMSYIGLESYVTQENWNYQRSMVCEFTPFYFSGARLQMFPAKKFRTELWLLNGWQTYNSPGNSPGIGNSNYWRPNENIQLVANFYLGRDTQKPDTLGNQSRRLRFHHDNSVVFRFYRNEKSNKVSQAALSINAHYGFQNNDQEGDTVKAAENYMRGISGAGRIWFSKNKLALSLRGDYLKNRSVINGKNTDPYLGFNPAVSSTVPNDYEKAIAENKALELFQFTVTFDIMPRDFITFRFEYGFRESNIPYFTGRAGTTGPDGWLNGQTTVIPWKADLRKNENRFTVAVNFRL